MKPCAETPWLQTSVHACIEGGPLLDNLLPMRCFRIVNTGLLLKHLGKHLHGHIVCRADDRTLTMTRSELIFIAKEGCSISCLPRHEQKYISASSMA